MHTMLEDGALLNQVKEVRIEDLLGRDPIQFDNRDIASFIEGEEGMAAAAPSAPSCAVRLPVIAPGCSSSWIFMRTMPTTSSRS